MTVADAHGEPTPRHREPMPSASTELRISAAPTREMYPKMKLHFSLSFSLALSASRFVQMECDVIHLMHDMKKSSGKTMWPFPRRYSMPMPIQFSLPTPPIRYKFSARGVFPDASSEPFHTYTSTPSLSLSGIGMRRYISDDSPLSLSLE